MSVEPRNPDPSILRKFELSKKEESLKNKLFKKKESAGQSHSRTRQHESPKSATMKSSATMKENLNLSNRLKEDSVSEKMLGGFLKNMENEFKELNKSIFIFESKSIISRNRHNGYA